MDWKNISFEEFDTLFIKPSDVNMESILNSADTPTKKNGMIGLMHRNLIMTIERVTMKTKEKD